MKHTKKAKALHITNHKGTIRNINNVIHMLNMDLDMDLETRNCNFPFFISFQDSHAIWNEYKDIVCGGGFDYLIFTDTSMYARPFLQFLHSHKAKIIIYVTNRFDWGMWGFIDRTFYELYSAMSHRESERVVFCSDNKYDMFYASLHNIRFLFDTNIRLTPKLSEQLVMPLEKNVDEGRIFIYNRGTKLDKYEAVLKRLSVVYDIFGPIPDTPYVDEKHICEYVGYLHLPYQVNIQSLWENLGAYIIYFIPSVKFIKELISNTDWYYWEEKSGKSYYNVELVEKSIDLSEWYCDENACLFEYFDSWEHLKEILGSKYKSWQYISTKKETIRKYMIENEKVNMNRWRDIFV
jgi:hypothetical protein